MQPTEQADPDLGQHAAREMAAAQRRFPGEVLDDRLRRHLGAVPVRRPVA